MTNVNFNIASTRTCCFTPAQATKVDAGIEIFKQVIGSAEFRAAVENFQWRTTEGVVFNRFYACNGMSNTQVADSIVDGTNWSNGLTNVVEGVDWRGTSNGTTVPTINVVPCSTRQDVEACCNNTTSPCICIDVNSLNNSWYTPVHVACAIMHEWCCIQGFDCCTTTSRAENWSVNTVPVACAWICKDVCPTVCNTTEVTNWCDSINNATFDYCACTTTFSNWTNTSNWVSPVTRIDECINIMEVELNWLRACTTVTPDITNRIAVLTNCCNAMSDMKVNLCNTSLDGCDVACAPAGVVATASSN